MDRLVQNGTKEVVGNRLAKKKLEKRKKGILKQRLKIPPSSNQFTKTFDKNLATNLFKMLLKYRAKGQITEKVEVEFSRILEVI
uniref:60S ribosomal protein L7a n=1 Tax=Cucumis melo TaxID=3656 RepID=A0A9I9EFT4_CUCME